MLSAKKDAWYLQPENTLKLKPWKKDTSDHMLLDLIPFLQFLATRHVSDVRDVVEYYDDKDIPKTFRQRMKEMSSHKRSSKHGSSTLGF